MNDNAYINMLQPMPASPEGHDEEDAESSENEFLLQEIENSFTYHAPFGDQTQRYEQLRAKAKEFALLIAELTPPSRERDMAIIDLETSVMWANAAIARNEQQVKPEHTQGEITP